MRIRGLIARTLLGVALLLGAGLVLGAGAADAHAVVVSSDPVDGSDVATAPTRVTITFDESVGLSSGYLRVIDSSARRVDSGSAFHPDGKGAVAAIDLRSGLPSAAYLVSFRVVSADSHPVSGVIRFTVGGASLSSAPADDAGATADGTTGNLLSVARAVTYLGLAAAGGWWLVILAGRYRDDEDEADDENEADDEQRPADAPPRPRLTAATRLLAAGLSAALVGAFGELLLQGPYSAGVGPGGIASADRLADTLAGSYGRWHLVLIAALAILLVLVLGRGLEIPLRSERATTAGVAALWLLVLVSVAATGHAAVDRPVWLGELSVIVHLIAMTVWIGGLAVLTVSVLRGSARAADVVLGVFSPVALVCVVALAATGAYQSWREVGHWRAFVDSEYGVLVLIKIGLFIVLIGLGVLARRVLQGRHNSGHSARHVRLRPGVVVELVVAVAVLCVSAVLVGQPPGKNVSAASMPADSATVTLDTGRTLSVQIVPARAGTVVIAAVVTGGPTVQAISATAELPARTIGPIPVELSALGQQRFGSLPVDLPAPGAWRFTLNVQTSAFDIVTAAVTITLAP